MILFRTYKTNNSVITASAKRFQSSYTFLNNQSLVEKEQVKNQKRTSKKSDVSSPENIENRRQKKRTQVELSARKRHDYSWLPKAPSTSHLKQRDVTTNMFYSGYRPVFINPSDHKKNESTLYEFAMKLEALGDPLPWISSATGTEFYGEWDNVPTDLIKKLKPFQPPYSGAETKNEEARKAMKKEMLAAEKEKLMNRAKGRRRPIIKLLQLNKKYEEDT
ncbi:LAFE_0G08482g1_1 [Lachancea fermentati]|uniref:LAFE_0G08482g1_1 n=1 Tax=Lachancea fermentati TaxID=4955 RepID=A0A1G4MHF4_LACFM|nr:LAFE_0G08482g1_1 [Lachancea fermentati]